MRKSYRDIISYSRTERNAIVVLLFILVITIAIKNPVLKNITPSNLPFDSTRYKTAILQIDSASKRNIAYKKYTYNNNYNAAKYTTHYSSKGNYPTKQKQAIKIEINSATTEEFKQLYGIGEVLSERIVKFRDKLGGFYSIEQLKHIYGINDSLYNAIRSYLTIKPATIRYININTDNYETIVANPYFTSTLTKQIIGYRTKVKLFSSKEDIKVLYYIKEHPEHYAKIEPYIKVNE